MIRNTVINTLEYFYPLGNTPAVSLSQDLPLEQEADVLLLGCGDARNVLFTTFVDPNRKFDITCCDIEPAIIARNILLYTLLADDIDDTNTHLIWNIYYHWKLDEDSLNFLEQHVDKLLRLSRSISEWQQSSYGSFIRFCDGRTLLAIRKFWIMCSSQGLTSTQKSVRNDVLRGSIEKARQLRSDILGTGIGLAGFRSAAPVGISALKDFATIATRWWNYGTTSLDEETKLMHLNPAFLSSMKQGLTLHYGTEPLLGFPMAVAYVPLSDNDESNVGKGSGGSSKAECFSTYARQQFRLWSTAFRKSTSLGTILRFCVADALALSLTFLTVGQEESGQLLANLFCNNWSSDTLVLDATEYTMSPHAPTRFNIIDTSNLVDHLGPLNLLPVCAALLKSIPSSTVYTECLVQNVKNVKERLADFLGGDLQTIALLIGLCPFETWTNVTSSPEDESIFNVLPEHTKNLRVGGATQTRSRLRWKPIHCQVVDGILPVISPDASTIARILAQVYKHMFRHENLVTLFADLRTDKSIQQSNPYYNRASFALLLRFIQGVLNTDWGQCVKEMISHIFLDLPSSPIGENFAQELLLYLHMFDIDTSRLPAVDINAHKNIALAPFFRSWSDLPAHVCMTVQVPRESVRPFTKKAGTSSGTPSLRCNVESGSTISRPWSNIFSCIQVSFGQATRFVEHGIPRLQIEEDGSGWWGESDMFVSTFVPTWMLLQPDGVVPLVKCGLLYTPQSCAAFVKELGMELNVFVASLTSKSVVLSRYMPGMSDVPRICPARLKAQTESTHVTYLGFSTDAIKIINLTQRVLFTSEAAKLELQDRKIPIQVHFLDAMRASIRVGTRSAYPIQFAFPVAPDKHKLRIARKSSYVEVEAPIWSPLKETSPRFLFPIAPPCGKAGGTSVPVPWTATRLCLDVLPRINLKDKKKMEWLISLTSMMFSTRERRVREAGLLNQLAPGVVPDVRIEMKDGLFSIFIHYAGLQGTHATAFGLSKAVGGINVLLLPSCLRLDIINRTVVLDAAVIPLVASMNADKKVRSFYQSLTSQGVMQIQVSDEELRCWKLILPAMVERCRTWKHTSKCEYTLKEEVHMMQGLEDGFSPLCSCGTGEFPTNFSKDMKLNNMTYILRRYATRIAISPLFALPYVEDCSFVDLTSVSPSSSDGIEHGCGKCGSKTRKDTSEGGRPLLVCSRCKVLKYCSADCQKAHWRVHKVSCSSEK